MNPNILYFCGMLFPFIYKKEENDDYERNNESDFL